MPKEGITTFAISIILGSISALDVEPVQAKPCRQILISQQHNVAGHKEITIDDGGMKVVSPDYHFTLCYDKQSDKVTAFNSQRKIYVVVDREYFLKSYTNVLCAVSWLNELKSPVRESARQINGMPGKTAYFKINNVNDDFWSADRSKSESGIASFSTLATGTFEEAGQILCRLYGFPFRQGLPYEFNYQSKDGESRKVLWTSSIKTSLVQSKMVLPKMAADWHSVGMRDFFSALPFNEILKEAL